MPRGKTLFVLVCAVLVVCVVLPSSAFATTIVYNNFGPGDTYDSSSYGVSGSGTGFKQVVAASFSGTGVNLGEADIALTYRSASGTNEVVVKLLGDLGGAPNRFDVLEQWTVTDIPITPGSMIFDLTSTSNPFLASGVQYWLAAFPGASDTLAAWNKNSRGAIGEDFSQSADGSAVWTSEPGSPTTAFRILATPEPSSILLLGSGLMALGMTLRRRWLS